MSGPGKPLEVIFMNIEDKLKSADSLWNIKQSVAVMCAGDETDREMIVRKFPSPIGLGTDGTCWTDAEHAENWRIALRCALGLLKHK